MPDTEAVAAAFAEVAWLNSRPSNPESLRGKLVLVDFWTYSCINSLRNLPYVKSWATKYKTAGLVVIGVHAPEFAFEKQRANVERAVSNLKVDYPIAIDSDYNLWNAFGNEYWPADYLIDTQGRMRYHHFGEGDYDRFERIIADLLRERGASVPARRPPAPRGVEAAAGYDVGSPETYLGYRRAERLVSPERVVPDVPKMYRVPPALSLNRLALGGRWNVGAESTPLEGSSGSIAFRFHSRDLHLVVGRRENGKPVRFCKIERFCSGRRSRR